MTWLVFGVSISISISLYYNTIIINIRIKCSKIFPRFWHWPPPIEWTTAECDDHRYGWMGIWVLWWCARFYLDLRIKIKYHWYTYAAFEFCSLTIWSSGGCLSVGGEWVQTNANKELKHHTCVYWGKCRRIVLLICFVSEKLNKNK